jgi:hypothetical protein
MAARLARAVQEVREARARAEQASPRRARSSRRLNKDVCPPNARRSNRPLQYASYKNAIVNV